MSVRGSYRMTQVPDVKPVRAVTLSVHPKVAAGGLATMVSTIIVWALKQWGGVEVPADVAVALAGVGSFILQYFVTGPDSAGQPQTVGDMTIDELEARLSRPVQEYTGPGLPRG